MYIYSYPVHVLEECKEEKKNMKKLKTILIGSVSSDIILIVLKLL